MCELAQVLIGYPDLVLVFFHNGRGTVRISSWEKFTVTFSSSATFVNHGDIRIKPY